MEWILEYSYPTAAIRSRGGLDEYQRAAPHRRHVAVRDKLKGRILAARGELERYCDTRSQVVLLNVNRM